MSGRVTIDVHGRQYSGDYTLDGDVVTVTLNGKSRRASVRHVPLILITRQLLRKLAIDEHPAIE